MTAASELMNPPCTLSWCLTFQPLSKASDHVAGASVKPNSCSSLFSLPRIPTHPASLPFPHLPGNEDFLKGLPQNSPLLGTSLIAWMEGDLRETVRPLSDYSVNKSHTVVPTCL